MSKDEPLFAKGKAQWLLENARKLSPDQRALLLALTDLDVAAAVNSAPKSAPRWTNSRRKWKVTTPPRFNRP